MHNMKRILTLSMVLFVIIMSTMAQRPRVGERSSSSSEAAKPSAGMETFCIAKDGKAATIVVDEQDWKGVIRAANDLADDVRKVSGVFEYLLRRYGSAVACHRGGGSGCSRPGYGISPLGGGRH